MYSDRKICQNTNETVELPALQALVLHPFDLQGAFLVLNSEVDDTGEVPLDLVRVVEREKSAVGELERGFCERTYRSPVVHLYDPRAGEGISTQAVSISYFASSILLFTRPRPHVLP